MERIKSFLAQPRALLHRHRKKILWWGLFILLMGLIPLLCFCRKPEPAPDDTGSAEAFCIYDEATGETLLVADRDFLIPAVVCEMPPLWETEALKAQAVAAYTYYDYQRAQNRAAGSDAPDLTCNTQTWLRYTTDDALRQRWGEQYDTYMARLTAIRDEVLGQRLTYSGQRVLAAYHAISSGRTESCTDIWGSGQPYLIPVDSPWDKQAEGYASAVSVPVNEFRVALLSSNNACDFSAVPAQWIEGVQRTDSGTVLTIRLGGQDFTGAKIRALFGLRSACFQCSCDGKQFYFQVQGYGHGVGMSQTGANAMAAAGADYREILSHYYPGTDLFCSTVG